LFYNDRSKAAEADTEYVVRISMGYT
jgi:hypothetical protein